MMPDRSEPSFRWLRLLLAAVRLLLLLSAVAVFAATALPALNTDQWLVRTLGYPALQLLLLGLLLAALLLILPSRSGLGVRWVSGAAVAVLLVSCLWNALRLAPYLRPLVAAGPIPTVASGSCPADRAAARVRG